MISDIMIVSFSLPSEITASVAKQLGLAMSRSTYLCTHSVEVKVHTVRLASVKTLAVSSWCSLLARSRAVRPSCKGKEQRCKVIIMCIRQRTCSVNYHILPSKHPWVLEIHGSKNGGGRLHGKAICTYMYIRIHIYKNHRIVKNWGWALTRETGTYLGDYGTNMSPIQTSSNTCS